MLEAMVDIFLKKETWIDVLKHCLLKDRPIQSLNFIRYLELDEFCGKVEQKLDKDISNKNKLKDSLAKILSNKDIWTPICQKVKSRLELLLDEFLKKFVLGTDQSNDKIDNKIYAEVIEKLEQDSSTFWLHKTELLKVNIKWHGISMPLEQLIQLDFEMAPFPEVFCQLYLEPFKLFPIRNTLGKNDFYIGRSIYLEIKHPVIFLHPVNGNKLLVHMKNKSK